MPKSYKLYLVAQCEQNEPEFLSHIEAALQAGVDVLQLRQKQLDCRSFFKLALKLKLLSDKYHTPLIINDRLDIALGVDASGVHLGQEDLDVKIARKLLGPSKLIGLSVSKKEHLKDLAYVDYLGVGAVFTTPTKTDSKAMGIDNLKELLKLCKLPVVAIGGICLENIELFKGLDLAGFAVVRAIMDAADPAKATRLLREKILEL